MTTNQKPVGFRGIEVRAETSSIENFRKQVLAGQTETNRKYAFISDEGSYMPGGEGTAPSPLSYFVAGMALCLISHVSQVAAKRKLSIRNERVNVTAHFHEQGSVLKGDAEGFCDGFEIEILIDSEEAPEKIADLIRISRKMCFAEKALMGTFPITVSPLLNQQPLDV